MIEYSFGGLRFVKTRLGRVESMYVCMLLLLSIITVKTRLGRVESSVYNTVGLFPSMTVKTRLGRVERRDRLEKLHLNRCVKTRLGRVERSKSFIGSLLEMKR